MAEETEETEETDIFYVQQQMLDTLTDLFMRQEQQQPIFVGPPAPQPPARNYMLYIGIGIGFLVLTGRLKL